jgi:hypothetical protein
VTPVTAIINVWNDDGSFHHCRDRDAPDFGQMLLSGKSSDLTVNWSRRLA